MENEKQKKIIFALIPIVIALLSFFVIARFTSSTEFNAKTIQSLDDKKTTVMELTAASTAASAAITLIPGDVGTPSRPLLCPPNVPDEADTLIIESTYGDSPRPPQPKDLEQRLAEIIYRTIAGGGNVVIPSFAVGRTQEILQESKAIFPLSAD